MHTSAHQPTPALAEYTGTLVHAAQVRAVVLDGEGHTVPCVYLDIELDNALHTQMHIEQPFPAGHHAQAQAAAHRLKKGTRVTVQAPLIGLRLVAANASHIHTLDTTTETTELCQQSSLL